MRYREPPWTLWAYATEEHPILVRCPRCDGRAAVVARPGHRSRYAGGRCTRVVCETCGCARDADGSRSHAA